ncbi:spore coat protein [Amycolatopsis aidingensis]|uniref:spore coat protein n=1 Tax=Amycolatopsis aidingensis TaxID=2842453 RepID=UPI001C0D6A44|nr:spore coat protein [Amycolatopsis aidingensis]
MRLLLRADASATAGAGHLARAVAFAEEARDRGWTVAFSGETAGAGWLAERLAELGVRMLAPVHDAAGLGTLAGGFDAVVVDHYGFGELRNEVNAAGAALVSLEGGRFGRRAADVVVDSGLRPADRPEDGSTVVLAGARFAPLRQSVLRAREWRARRRPRGEPPRVVVVLGGGAVWQHTVTRLLHALRDTGLPFEAEALAHGEPRAPAPAPGQRFLVLPPDTELPRRLAEADLVLSAAGVTLLELCCIGAPAALVCLVDNQERGYRAAVEQELAAGLGSPAELDGAAELLRPLLRHPSRREELAERAAGAVDGRGAARVLDELHALRLAGTWAAADGTPRGRPPGA